MRPSYTTLNRYDQVYQLVDKALPIIPPSIRQQQKKRRRQRSSSSSSLALFPIGTATTVLSGDLFDPPVSTSSTGTCVVTWTPLGITLVYQIQGLLPTRILLYRFPDGSSSSEEEEDSTEEEEPDVEIIATIERHPPLVPIQEHKDSGFLNLTWEELGISLDDVETHVHNHELAVVFGSLLHPSGEIGGILEEAFLFGKDAI